MATDNRRKKAGYPVEAPFVGLPHRLLKSAAWRDLSPKARDLFLEFMLKVNGANNGDLSVTFDEARKAGITANARTFYACRDHLFRNGFLFMTRESRRRGEPHLCAVTVAPTYPNKEKNIAARRAYNDWASWKPGGVAPGYRVWLVENGK